jgi:hypothetical protein
MLACNFGHGGAELGTSGAARVCSMGTAATRCDLVSSFCQVALLIIHAWVLKRDCVVFFAASLLA